MNLKSLFPHASKSTLELNSELPNPKPSKQKGTLVANGTGKTQSTRRPHVCFTLCRTKLLDVDAKYGSIKDLLDSLQYAGLVDGDREDQITLEVKQEKVSHRSEERTVIELEYPTDGG